MKVKFSYDAGLYANKEEILDLPDDTTEQDLDDQLLEWLGESVQWDWKKVQDND